MRLFRSACLLDVSPHLFQIAEFLLKILMKGLKAEQKIFKSDQKDEFKIGIWIWSSRCRFLMKNLTSDIFWLPHGHLLSILVLEFFHLQMVKGKKNWFAHYGPKQQRIQTEVLGHSLIHSLVRSHRSLIRMLRTARFARALRCAHSFARSLTSLTPSLPHFAPSLARGKVND